jgi:hypothetical protein
VLRPARTPAPSRVAPSFLLAAVLLLSTSGVASAFTTEWSPSSGLLPNQIPCPWTLTNNTANPPTMANGKLTLATSVSNANNMFYSQTGAALAMPVSGDSLVVEFGMRLVSGSSGSSVRGPANLVLETSAFRGVAIHVGLGEVFWDNSSTTRGGTASVATTDAVHDFRVVVIIATGALRIYRDGALLLLGSTHVDGVSGDFTGTPRILWGEGSSLAFGTSEWSYFSHNAAPGGTCGTTSDLHATWGELKIHYH